VEDPDSTKQNDRNSDARLITDFATKLIKQGLDVPSRQGGANGTGEDQFKSVLVLPLLANMVPLFGTFCCFR
jgi:hypothetical protein